MGPSLGRIVLYRSRTGDYDVPAIVTATVATLNPKGVELGHIPRLSGDEHVHLTCFTAGKPGKRRGAEDFLVESAEPRSENVSGCYQEWDIPHAEAPELPYDSGARGIAPGTWRWPERVA